MNCSFYLLHCGDWHGASEECNEELAACPHAFVRSNFSRLLRVLAHLGDFRSETLFILRVYTSFLSRSVTYVRSVGLHLMSSLGDSSPSGALFGARTPCHSMASLVCCVNPPGIVCLSHYMLTPEELHARGFPGFGQPTTPKGHPGFPCMCNMPLIDVPSGRCSTEYSAAGCCFRRRY